MKRQHAAYFLALPLSLLPFSALAAEPPKKSDAPFFDPKDRATWSKAVAHSQEDRLKLSKALAAIALDKNREATDRDLAVQLLAEIRDPHAISFLIDNIALEVLVCGLQDADFYRNSVCYHHLGKGSAKNDWNVAKAILAALDKKKTEEEIVYLMMTYKFTLGETAAHALIDVELGKRPGPVKKKQLEYIKKGIPQN